MNMQSPDFYNYSRLGETRNPDNENPPFIWPGVNIRNISNDGVSVRMARGFMRSILTDPEIVSAFSNPTQVRQTKINTSKDGKSHYRLNFQFNPEYIERSVAQTPGAVNPILQSVSNLTQPIPGSATFNFTMTFNRELEVAAAGNRADSQTLWSGNDLEDPDFSDSLRDPGLVGVWADLHMFDLIVGQGITEELLDLVSAFTEVQAAERSMNESTTTDGEGTEEPKDGEEKDSTAQTDPDATSFDINKFNKNFRMNFGNSAFLNPLPVRIVFSDTFMVEGMVTGTSVAFQKFNHRMIPTICQINVNFTAMYLGFAKKKAFLTTNLTEWAKDQKAANKEKEDLQLETGKKLAAGISTVSIWPNTKVIKESFEAHSLVWSEQNAPNFVGNQDSFLIHSKSNANPSSVAYYDANTMYLGHYYNIVNTKLYKNNVDITQKARSLYSSSLPLVVGVAYKPVDKTLNTPDFDIKLDLVYKYADIEQPLIGKEIVVPCTISPTLSGSTGWGTSPYVDAKSTYICAFNVTLGKLPGIGSINNKLTGTENLPDVFYKNLTFRVTVTPSITTQIDGESITASYKLNPLDFKEVYWDTTYDLFLGRELYRFAAVASTPGIKPPPPRYGGVFIR
jgi:hypothetical protein